MHGGSLKSAGAMRSGAVRGAVRRAAVAPTPQGAWGDGEGGGEAAAS
jgi:hypothetical protein